MCTNAYEANAQLGQIKNMGINLVALPIQTLHALHQGVLDELRIREQCTILDISEVKMNNEQIFVEKAQALKEKEELTV